MRCDELVLHAADGEHVTAQRQLARHRRVSTHSASREQTHQRRREGDTRTRAVLVNRSSRQVDCNIRCNCSIAQCMSTATSSSAAQEKNLNLLNM